MNQRPIYQIAVPFGLVIAGIVRMSSFMLATPFNPADMVMHFITNFIFYSLLCAGVVWLWR